MATSFDPHPDSVSPFQQLLHRPLEQRAREFKYRFAQAAIFGLPVIALQMYGRSLGGSPQEAQRWVALLQALLAGWVTYVAAMGILAEGLFLLAAARRVMIDLPVALLGVMMYLYSAIATCGIFFTGQLLYGPLLFHWTVLLLGAWSGARWALLAWRTA
jgi:cation transport ATPase